MTELTNERAAPLLPCPECQNEYLAIRTDIYKNQREFVYCDCCGCIAVRSVWNAIARRATVACDKPPSSECVSLPPLPDAFGSIEVARGVTEPVYTAEQVEQIRREAMRAGREYQRKVNAKIIARRDAEVADLRAQLACQSRGDPARLNRDEVRDVLRIAREMPVFDDGGPIAEMIDKALASTDPAQTGRERG